MLLPFSNSNPEIIIINNSGFVIAIKNETITIMVLCNEKETKEDHGKVGKTNMSFRVALSL
ncbi:MAG: hypothetical protein K2K26_01705, partial [Muribaculaceae bacterium]|nr:hypothetical protein [Muribaculaceae bacterium]